jgi:hypothetical protein
MPPLPAASRRAALPDEPPPMSCHPNEQTSVSFGREQCASDFDFLLFPYALTDI